LERKERREYELRVHAEFGTKQDRMHFRQLQQCKQLSSRNQLLIHRHETEKTRAFKEYALISITRLVLMLCCRVHTRYENQLQLLDETHNISQHHVEQTFVAPQLSASTARARQASARPASRQGAPITPVQKPASLDHSMSQTRPAVRKSIVPKTPQPTKYVFICEN